MSTLPYASAHVEPQLPFKDKRTTLTLVGVVCFLISACTGCLTAVTPLALFVPNAGGQPGMSARDLVPAAVLYLLVTALFGALGVGCVRARRWVRPLLLPIAWTWLASGLLAAAAWIVAGPGITDVMEASAAGGGGPAPSADELRMIMIATVAGMVAIGLLLPALLVWRLSPAAVRLTAEYFSPPAWTDGRPLPVLAVGIWLAFTALMVLVGVTYPAFPLFGTVLTRAAAVIAMVITAALLALLAVRVVQRRPWAWGATVAVVVLWALNSIVTTVRVHPLETQRLAGRPQQEIDAAAKVGAVTRGTEIATTVVFAAAILAYLLYARRYFNSSPPPALPPADGSALAINSGPPAIGS